MATAEQHDQLEAACGSAYEPGDECWAQCPACHRETAPRMKCSNERCDLFIEPTLRETEETRHSFNRSYPTRGVRYMVAERYVAGAACAQCGHAMPTRADATAIYRNRDHRWLLVHRVGSCEMDAILAENQLLAGAHK